MSESELERVAQRAADSNLCALGLRFSDDLSAPSVRFATLRERLGDAFEVIELDSSAGNPGGFSRSAHSVLIRQLRETPGHPALQARARVVAFLRERISASG